MFDDLECEDILAKIVFNFKNTADNFYLWSSCSLMIFISCYGDCLNLINITVCSLYSCHSTCFVTCMWCTSTQSWIRQPSCICLLVRTTDKIFHYRNTFMTLLLILRVRSFKCLLFYLVHILTMFLLLVYYVGLRLLRRLTIKTYKEHRPFDWDLSIDHRLERNSNRAAIITQ